MNFLSFPLPDLPTNDTVALVNNTAKTEDYTVPAGECWILYGGKMSNGDSVARNPCTVTVRDPSGNHMLTLATENLASGSDVVWPEVIVGAFWPVTLMPTMILRFYWPAGGASAGGNSTVNIWRAVIHL